MKIRAEKCRATANAQRVVLRLLGVLLLLLLISVPLSCAKIEIEGKKAPDFTLDRVGGGKLSLSEYHGRPVIIYWFSSW